jgi:hypothetical protein
MVAIPDTPVTSTAADGVLPSIQGSVFGGHAPLAYAHIYVLQPGTTGYGSQASSLLTAGSGTTKNTSDPNVPTTWYYVAADANGNYNISGDYTCKANQPVYLYAYGGTPTTLPTKTTPLNAAVVNLAVLGDCPGSAPYNFGSSSSAPISFIYMNEVSTVAAAYAFQPFTVATNNDATHIGSSGTDQALAGIENAARTASQLYGIQGNYVSTTQDGEGHIANPYTQITGSYGIVPQATLDTLGNILAACVDSGNTSNPATAPACTTLFATATATGATTGTKPTDTATAAINIARFPAGTGNTSFVSTIYNIPTGTVPFTPALTTRPNDFTVAIVYPQKDPTYPSIVNSYLDAPESIAVDGVGNIWATSQGSDTIFEWTNQGANKNAAGTALTNHTDGFIYGYVNIDPANSAWAGNANGNNNLTKITSTGTITNTGANVYNSYTVLTTGTGGTTPGNVYYGAAPNNGANYQLYARTDNGGNVGGTPISLTGNANGGLGTGDTAHGAVDSASDLWFTSESGHLITRVTEGGANAGACPGYVIFGGCYTGFFNPTNYDFQITLPTTSPQGQPEVPAIDNANNAWIPIQFSNQIYKVSPDGSSTTIISNPILADPFGAAVDGNGNIWVTNRGSNSLSELSPAGAFLSPANNFIPQTQIPSTAGSLTNLLNAPLNIVVDQSGNLWITNYGATADGTGTQNGTYGGTITEIVGAAAPTVMPLSYAAANAELGAKP